MADREAIQVPGLKASGRYSQAVRAAGLLFVAGHPGVLPYSGEHDLNKRRELIVNLRRYIHDYEDSINKLLRT